MNKKNKMPYIRSLCTTQQLRGIWRFTSHMRNQFSTFACSAAIIFGFASSPASAEVRCGEFKENLGTQEWRIWCSDNQTTTQENRNCIERSSDNSWFEFRFDLDQGTGAIGSFKKGGEFSPSSTWVGKKISDIPDPFNFSFTLTKDDYGSYVNGAWMGVYGWATPPGESWTKGYEFYIVQDWFGHAHPGRTDVWGGTLVDSVGYVDDDGQRYFCRVSKTGVGATQIVSYRQYKKTTGTVNVKNHVDYWINHAVHTAGVNGSQGVPPEALGDPDRLRTANFERMGFAAEALGSWAMTGKVRFTQFSIPEFDTTGIPAGVVRLKNDTGTYLHTNSNSAWQGAALEFRDEPTWIQQKWKLVPVDDTYYKIISQHNFLSIWGGNIDNKAWLAPDTSAQDRLWEIESLGGGRYRFVNKKNGYALTGGSGINGGAIYLRSVSSAAGQKWSIEVQ